MSLSKKYGVPDGVIKAMMNDGVISCTWAGREAVYQCYLKNRTTSKSRTEAVHQTAADMNCSISHVWDSIQPLER